MKKSVALLVFLLFCFLAGISLSAQTSSSPIDEEKVLTGIKKIAESFTEAMLANVLTGSVWNTSHRPDIFGLGFNIAGSISNFQHFVNLNTDSSKPFNFDASEIPGFAINPLIHLRIPIFSTEIPLDIGVYGFSIPYGQINHKKDKISSVIFDDVVTIGFDTRWDFFGDKKIHSDKGLNVAFSYFYQSFGINIPSVEEFQIKSKSKTISSAIVSGDYGIKFDFDSHVFGIKGQYSQLFLGFIELMGGLEPYFGIMNIRVISNGNIRVKTEKKEYSLREYLGKYKDKIKTNLLSDSGLSYGRSMISGGMRLYGGFSLKIFFLILDSGISYDPFHNTVGASLGARLAF